MDGGWLVRMRWRRRGAWLWPAFVVATVLEAVIGHLLPPAGERQTVIGAALSGLVLNLVAVLLLSRPLGALLRRRRGDLPAVIARNYAGTAAVGLVMAALLIAGLVHRPAVMAHRRAMADAIARAQAWIGMHAPAEFRRHLEYVSTLVIQPGSVFRECVLSGERPRTYCVIVDTGRPVQQSVHFAGYEPNAIFGQGVG